MVRGAQWLFRHFQWLFGASAGFHLGLLSAQMQVSPSGKGSKRNVPLSSGKCKAWKARALSAVGSTRSQTALRKLSMLHSVSLPRTLVALCHPGFLLRRPWYFPLTARWYIVNLHVIKMRCPREASIHSALYIYYLRVAQELMWLLKGSRKKKKKKLKENKTEPYRMTTG